MAEWLAGWLSAEGATSPSLFMLPVIALLGALGAVGSCCNGGLLASMAGYAAAKPQADGDDRVGRGRGIAAGLGFALGSVLGLTGLGLLSSWAGGPVAGPAKGLWSLGTGLLMVAFGLWALKLLPALPPVRVHARGMGWSRVGGFAPAFFGLALGGGQAACSGVCACNPALLLALTYSMRGDGQWL